jgi:hypothetical protein
MTVDPFLVSVPRDREDLSLLANERFVHMGPKLAPSVSQTAQSKLVSLLKVVHQMLN